VKESTATALSNIAYYSFLGLTAYFVTPYVLFSLLIVTGFSNSEYKEKNE